MRALPNHILQALQAWAMVTKDRRASDSSFGSFMKCGAKGKDIWFLDPISIL